MRRGHDLRLKGGKTVLMLVAAVPDPRLAGKLIDLVCARTTDFWARDSCGRHVIMDACFNGVHVSVLLRLIRWARRGSLKTVALVSKRDVQGLDAVELAIQGGHGELASCLLDQRGPASRNHLLCARYPLEVLELAIESGNKECVRAVLGSKRVKDSLQPGKTEHLNLTARWTQRQTPNKRLHNIFTCVGAAVRSGMPDVVEAIFEINPDETRQAVWYTFYKLRSQRSIETSPRLQRMATSYLLDKVWPQISVIVLLRHWELVAKYERTCSAVQRIRRWWRCGHRDWEAIASHPCTSLPSDVFSRILSFLMPSEVNEARKMIFLAEY